jgi:hypothetical protein
MMASTAGRRSRFDGVRALGVRALMVAAALSGALSVGRPARVTAQEPAPSAPKDSADGLMRTALASALQAQGRPALTALRAIDSTGLSGRYASTRRCMLERLGARRAPDSAVRDPAVGAILFTYREYWFRSLLAEHPAEANERWLLDSLNALVGRQGGRGAATLDSLEPVLTALIEPRGYHVLLGVTSPLRELMLWRTETVRRYDVTLPEGPQPVTVVFMDDFASLGWAGFATCNRHHTGGWTKPDRLYAVRSAYDTTSENFRVSYLAHEAQHYWDNHRLPTLEAQDQLEYRAKLVELAVADGTAHTLLEGFASNTSDDLAVPHSYANGRLVRDLRRRLFPGASPDWHRAGVRRINSAAAALLREDTARLRRTGGR